MKLVRLPNGDCIDPTAVLAVRTAEYHRCEFTKTVHKDRVIVDYRTGDHANHIVIGCPSLTEAERMRETIIELVNGGRS